MLNTFAVCCCDQLPVQQCYWDDGSVEGQVESTVQYHSGTYANFYHGFHQPGRIVQQEMRWIFEWGDRLLRGWSPTYLCLHATADESHIQSLFDAQIDAFATYKPKDRLCTGHGHEFVLYQELEQYWGDRRQKLQTCTEHLQAFVTDQLARVCHRDHVRKASE